MCRRSASDYEISVRTSAERMRTTSTPRRSLVEVLRDLLRPRRPQGAPAEVVPFPAEGAVRTDEEVDREGSKAA